MAAFAGRVRRSPRILRNVPVRSSSTYFLLLATAAVAAVVCWQAIGRTHPWTPLPEELVAVTQPTQEQLDIMRSHHRANDTYAFVIFGAACMAAGAPVYIRGLRLPFQIASILAAVVTGALTGAAMGGIGFYFHDWMPITWDALVRVAVRWMGMLLPTGIAAALFVVICQRALRQAVSLLVGGAVGSILAALAYALIAALLLQTGSSDSVLPLDATCQLIVFSVAPFFIWATIAHQRSTEPLSVEESMPKELEAA